jgi:hypothetical protein
VALLALSILANVTLLDDAAEIKNPDGMSRDIALDFVTATLRKIDAD